MGLALAFKAFLKAWKEPEKGEKFVAEITPKQIESQDLSHLRLLTSLQHAGRLIDFLKEDITPYNDAQIGSAVRKIHSDCAALLEELITIRPLMDEPEGKEIHVPRGYHPAEIKLVGKVKGEPPYTGVLTHRGWKAHKRALPKKNEDPKHSEIIFPAEVEIK